MIAEAPAGERPALLKLLKRTAATAFWLEVQPGTATPALAALMPSAAAGTAWPTR